MPRKFTSADKELFAKGGRNKARPPEVKEARKMNRAEVERVLQQISEMTEDQLEIYAKDPNRIMLERFVIAIYRKGVKEGDTHRLNFLLDRMIGPVPKIIDKVDTKTSERVTKALDQIKVLFEMKEKRK